MREKSVSSKKGIGLIEIIVALGIVGGLLAISSQLLSYTLVQIRKMEEQSRAYHLAQDAIEATKNMRDKQWEDIENIELQTSHYAEIVDGEWVLHEGTLEIDAYTLDVFLENVYRDEFGEIVESGSIIDPNMRKVIARVCWGEVLANSVEFTGGTTQSDLTNFPNNSGWGDPGQSFTTSTEAINVNRVSLYLAKAIDEPSDIFLEIRSDSTVGTVLGTSNTIESDNLSTELTWQDFIFSSPVALSPSTQYFLRLRSIPDSTIPWSGAEGPIYWGYIHTAYSPPGYGQGEAWRYIGQNENPGYQGIELDQYDYSFLINESSCPGNQTKSVSLSNYLTDWQYVNNFIYYFTQTNQADFEAGTGSDIDTIHQPGNLELALDPLLKPELGYDIEDFESYSVGQNPTDWYDSKADYNLEQDDSLFEIYENETNTLGTGSHDLDIHTHYNGTGAADWDDYEIKGRFLISNTDGGIGMTFYSTYPTEDKYFRIGSFGSGNSWHIEARNTTLSEEGVNDRDTEVEVENDIWYWLRVQVKNVNEQVLIVAKAWKDTEVEPASWQIDCFDESSTRPLSGTVGLWASGDGDKYIDDLEIRDLTNYVSEEGTLESSILDTEAASNFGKIIWEADNPANTSLKFQVRTADDEASLSSATWYGPTSESDYYETIPSGEKLNIIHKGDRFTQYKAYLSTSDTSFSPSLQEISISYVNQ